MKTFIKKISVIIAVFSTIALLPIPAYAVPESDNPPATPTTPSASTEHTYGDCYSFLGMTSWDCHLAPTESEAALKNNILLIATNILNDLVIIATYLVIGYVIYGGYLYIFASGDTAKVANGKKTITRAFIGLAIVMSAKAIVNTIHIVYLNNSGAFTLNNVDANTVVTNTITWFIGTAGVVALIYVVVGGIGYITSAGDAAKLQKSKNAIFYSLIGLFICAISLIATGFVSNMIREANKTSFNNETLISKETHEK